jgi:hypothetical protein
VIGLALEQVEIPVVFAIGTSLDWVLRLAATAVGAIGVLDSLVMLINQFTAFAFGSMLGGRQQPVDLPGPRDCHQSDAEETERRELPMIRAIETGPRPVLPGAG